jgi:nucleoside phosphorylase/O-acetyl-ADP-ribose deacetylase (regulator of RNase III)
VVDIIVLTALPVEHRAVLRALGGAERVGRHRVAARCLAGMGNTGAAAGAQQLIDMLRPAAVLLVGIAGGAPQVPALTLGDVLVADAVVGYEPGRRDHGGLHQRPDVHRPAFALVAAAREVEADEWAPLIGTERPGSAAARPRSHVGTVLSGEKVIADADALAELSKAWPKTVGIEMEGLGVATASYRSGAGFLLIKAVSDLADGAKDDTWQEYASEAAAHFALAVLRRAELPQRPGDDLTAEADAGEPAMFELTRPSPCRLGVVAGSIRRVRFAEAWVSSENTDMEMSRAAEFTISGIVRYWGAHRDGSGRIVDDVIARELAERVGPSRPVMPGAAFVTGPGSLAGTHNVRAIIHVASVQGEPGAGFRQVRNVGVCVTNALARAEELGVASIVFPLLGVASGHGDVRATATAMCTAALDHLAGRPSTSLRAIYFLGYARSELRVLTDCLSESPYLHAV